MTQFSVPAVRHLTWCLFSPPLARLNVAQSLYIDQSESLIQWLNSLNTDPSHLLEYIQQTNHRLLGSYFECLWQYFFQYSPNTQLLAHHIQVNELNHKGSQQTLGELDALASVNHEYLHVELAVKFYLLVPNALGTQTEHWIGPQTRDRLDLKLNTLTNKQFPFLQHPKTQQTLLQRNLNHSYTPKLAMKGYLFTQVQTEYSLPAECTIEENTQPHMGQWLHASSIADFLVQNGADAFWGVIDKHDWLGPFYTHNQDDLLDHQQVRTKVTQHFNKQEKGLEGTHKKHKHHNPQPYALMLVLMKAENQGFIEVERFFVVPDGWPFQLGH